LLKRGIECKKVFFNGQTLFMNTKGFLVALLPLLVCHITFAQDRIVKTNGRVITANVKNVGIRTVVYSRYNDPKGKEYSISRDHVSSVEYGEKAKGTAESDDDRDENNNERMTRSATRNAAVSDRENDKVTGAKYKPNILSIAPVQFTENGIAGIGISYERSLGKNGIVALYMPAAFVGWSGDHNSQNFDMVGNPKYQRKSDGMAYLMPGIKIYPTGKNGLVKYAIGPSLVMAAGQQTRESMYACVLTYNPTGVISPNFPTSYTETDKIYKVGMIVNQSVNVNPSPRLCLGAEFGFGVTYLNRVGGISKELEGLAQFNFKIGYRF
jgi:hypothetical protein